MKVTSFIIKYQVYPFDMMVVFCEDPKDLIAHLSKTFDKEAMDFIKSLAFGIGKTIMTPTGQTILWLNKKPETCFEHGTLQHEIFHAVCFLMDRIGIVFSKESDEAFAYMIGYITKEIYIKMEKIK